MELPSGPAAGPHTERGHLLCSQQRHLGYNILTPKCTDNLFTLYLLSTYVFTLFICFQQNPRIYPSSPPSCLHWGRPRNVCSSWLVCVLAPVHSRELTIFCTSPSPGESHKHNKCIVIILLRWFLLTGCSEFMWD